MFLFSHPVLFTIPFAVKNTWSVLETRGALVQGGYGHSSVYDPQTRSIYIHGGYKAFSANKYGLAGDLYRYEVDKRMWYVKWHCNLI